MPIPVATRYKAWVCGLSVAGIADWNSQRGHGYLSLLSGRGLCDGPTAHPEESV